MTLLEEYLEEIVKPTFQDFRDDYARHHAFLLALALYHSIDRAHADQKRAGTKLPKGVRLRNVWGQESVAFQLIDAVAHRFKHGQSDLEAYLPKQWNPEPERPGQWVPKMSIGSVLEPMIMVQFRATAADALKFIEGTLTNPPVVSNQKPPKYKPPLKSGPSPDAMRKYIEEMVDPTFEEFGRNVNSPRHAFLACVAAFHAIDRAAESDETAALIEMWHNESFEFYVMDMICHHLKHTKSKQEKDEVPAGSIPLAKMVFGTGLKAKSTDRQTLLDGGIALHSLLYLTRDAIQFLKRKAMTP